jgi:hypothetical protein
MEDTVEKEKIHSNDTPLTEQEIIQILQTKFHQFEELVGRKMTYAEEKTYGEARDIRG